MTHGVCCFTRLLQQLRSNGWNRVALLFARLEVFEKAGSCLALDGFGSDGLRLFHRQSFRCVAVGSGMLGSGTWESRELNLVFSLKVIFDAVSQVWFEWQLWRKVAKTCCQNRLLLAFLPVCRNPKRGVFEKAGRYNKPASLSHFISNQCKAMIKNQSLWSNISNGTGLSRDPRGSLFVCQK